MAASSRGIRDKCGAKSAFETPQKGQKEKRSWLDPPIVSVTPYATVGLQSLYTQVHKKEPFLDNDTNDFTDENGVFCPKPNMPLLARRYRFRETIGSGVSSITICAQDTFRPDQDKVAIKILNVSYYRLGYQESSSMRQLNKADPDDFSGTLRLLNIFSFSGHFCMVFELLHPKPLHHYFRRMDNSQEKLRWIRRVTIRLLQVLGFLQQENVIHADLKPENVLCKSDDLSSGIKVIDFGNAIHCVYDELSLYYDDFELQTLLYRAPEAYCSEIHQALEVLYGLPFGLEIDMWSLGCILAELYIGKPLFYALTKEKLLQRMVSVLGPLPSNLLQRGKFYQEYSSYTGKSQSSLVTWAKLHTELLGVSDPHFVSFIAAMLQYNLSDRISVWDAFQHPFLAPEIAVRYLLPPSQSDQKKNYPQIGISSSSYNLSPAVSSKIAKDRLSTVDMLRHGTSADRSDTRPGFIRGLKSSNGKVVAEVTPFVNQQQRDHRTHIPAFQVQPQLQQQSRASTEESHRRPAFQVPPPVIASTEVPLQFSLGRRMPRIQSNMRKPVAIPGKFAATITQEKQEELDSRDSDKLAYFHHSSHMHQIGTLISEELQHEELSSIPSTSTYQHTQSKPSVNRTVFPNEVTPSNPRGDTPKVFLGRDVTELSEDPNQEESVQSSRMDTEGSKSKRKSSDMDRRDVPLQRGEIFLTRVKSQDFPRMAKTNPKQVSVRSTTRSDRSPSPMSRWNNLEKMRSEALRKNKKEIKEQKQVQNSDGCKILNSRPATVKTEKTLPEPTPSSIGSSEGVPSSSDKVAVAVDLPSPSGTNQISTPTTPSHLTASISKLRCRTPVTPSDSTVLLVSEFPTPDDNTKGIAGKCKSQSSLSSDEGSLEVGERRRGITAAVIVEDEDSDDDSRQSWESGSVTRQETEVVTMVIDKADEGLVNNGRVVKKEQMAKETAEASRTKSGAKGNRGRKRKIHQELQEADNLKTKAGSGCKNSPKIVKRSTKVSAKKSLNTQNSPSVSTARSGKAARKRTPTPKMTTSSQKRGKQSKLSKSTNVNKKTVATPNKKTITTPKQNRSKKTSVGGNSRKGTPSHDPKRKASRSPTLTKKKVGRSKKGKSKPSPATKQEQGKSKPSPAKKPKQGKSKSSPTKTLQMKVSTQMKAQDRRQAKVKATDQIADIFEFESDVPSIDDRDDSSDGSSYESGPVDDLQSEDQLDYDEDEELWQDDQSQKNNNGDIKKDKQVEANQMDVEEKEEDQMEEDEVLLL